MPASSGRSCSRLASAAGNGRRQGAGHVLPPRPTPKRATKPSGVVTSIVPARGRDAEAACGLLGLTAGKFLQKAAVPFGGIATKMTPATPIVPFACFWNAGFQKFSG